MTDAPPLRKRREKDMRWRDPYGPPAPPPLVLVDQARSQNWRLRVGCTACRHAIEIEAASALAGRIGRLPIGELWLNGVFRCSRCKAMASYLHVFDPLAQIKARETWGLGERNMADRLRRHWRWRDRSDIREDTGMCNNYRLTTGVQAIADLFRDRFQQPLTFPEGVPNAEPNDDIRIGDRVPILCLDGDRSVMVTRPWSWKGPGGRPVFNFRSEGRFIPPARRCLIPADGFYEFTDPAAGGAKRKDRWLFTVIEADWFWIAGVMHDGAFAMLTTEPSPDVKPYHDRQVVVLRKEYPGGWLNPAATDRWLHAGDVSSREIEFDVHPAPRP
ncbi:SOS response-associated peptidase family protein [uncultured Brevundimonas sp.]|uniref:SOS response-associated peptidase family protein n=1 Tax=uncultured Brevundimonas sp. TaxID=213418 RepID=UPI00259748F2|nr:SOS response-associated peptidase family protein [uncultured Brevundimonas sp.]